MTEIAWELFAVAGVCWFMFLLVAWDIRHGPRDFTNIVWGYVWLLAATFCSLGALAALSIVMRIP